MYIKTRYLQRTSSNYTNGIIASVLLLTLLVVVLSDGVLFDLAECSLLIEVLTLVNVLVISTLLISSVSTYTDREQTIQQVIISYMIWSIDECKRSIWKSSISNNSPQLLFQNSTLLLKFIYCFPEKSERRDATQKKYNQL